MYSKSALLMFLQFCKRVSVFKDFDAHQINLSFFFFKRELMTHLERSKVLLIKTKLLLHYV